MDNQKLLIANKLQEEINDLEENISITNSILLRIKANKEDGTSRRVKTMIITFDNESVSVPAGCEERFLNEILANDKYKLQIKKDNFESL